MIVSYPVSFLLAALGLADTASLLRRRSATIALATAAAIAAAFVALTLSFQAFVRQHGGTAGAYWVIYDDTAALAAAAHARNLHIADAPAEYLAWGHLNVPNGTTRVVTIRIRLSDTFAVCRARGRGDRSGLSRPASRAGDVRDAAHSDEPTPDERDEDAQAVHRRELSYRLSRLRAR